MQSYEVPSTKGRWKIHRHSALAGVSPVVTFFPQRRGGGKSTAIKVGDAVKLKEFFCPQRRGGGKSTAI